MPTLASLLLKYFRAIPPDHPLFKTDESAALVGELIAASRDENRPKEERAVLIHIVAQDEGWGDEARHADVNFPLDEFLSENRR